MAPKIEPKEIFSQLLERYLKLSMAQRIALPTLLLFGIWAVVYASRLATAPEYGILYSELGTSDAGAVIQRLKELKVAYRLEGSTISISPPAQVHELRLQLASEGVPKSGTVGYEIFDGTSFATTTMGEMVKKQRALQGELERTIMSLDAVVAARVHISQPERTIFAKSAQEPGASVLLKLKPGSELDKKQINGITNFVASGVEGLKPELVTIIDEFGNLLSDRREEGEDFGVDATRLQYLREVERGYVQRIESMLAKVLGPGKVVARVTAELDFSSNEREEESYDPAGRVIRSERSVEEGSGSEQRGGVPGVVSNLSNDPKSLPQEPGEATERNSRKEQVKNFEISRAVTRTTQARGALVRLSAAVLVDGKLAESPELDGEGKPTGKVLKSYEGLTPEVLTQVEGIVRSAIGFDAARGDVVTVENVPFFTPDEGLQAELAKAHQTDRYLKFGGMMVPVVALALFVLFVLRPLIKFLTTSPEEEYDLKKLLPGDILNNPDLAVGGNSRASLGTRGAANRALGSSDMTTAQIGASDGADSEEGSGDSQEARAANNAGSEGDSSSESRERFGFDGMEPSINLEQFEEIVAENVRLVKANPQQAALLIRYWLNDGRI